jgi:predicted nucleic acid-binding Zn ribbon protein
MQPLRDTATDSLRALLTSQPTTDAKVMFAWRMAAGPALSRAARAAWRDGALRLTPADPAWRRELQRAKPVLLDRLRHWLGADVIQAIVIESSSEAERFPHA